MIYKVYQTKTEYFYQEVEADSIDEAIELSDDCDSELILIDGTATFTVDIESTREFNEFEEPKE
jgi:hypothetical protein